MSGHEAEVSEPFLDGMRNRMYVSFHKYGPVADAYPHKIDAMETLAAVLDKYLKSGNTEYLMDVANYAMIEFMHPAHPNAFFKATDSDESVGRVEHGSNTPGQWANRDLLPVTAEDRKFIANGGTP